MNIETPRMRQLVDWRAAIQAGVISSLVFFVLELVLIPLTMGGNSSIVMRYLASLLLGKGVLPPSDSSGFGAFMAALLMTVVMGVIFSCIIAFVIHRGGILTGIFGGALLGLALYLINFYTLTLIFPWFYVLTGWMSAFNHIIYGALAGGIYEGLEVEIFVPVEQ